MSIAVKACRFAMAAFVLPFAFIYDPAVLLDGTPLEIVTSTITVAFAVFLLSIAAEGYLRRALPWWSRLVCVTAALCYLIPTPTSLIYGTLVTLTAFLPLKPWQHRAPSGEPSSEV